MSREPWMAGATITPTGEKCGLATAPEWFEFEASWDLPPIQLSTTSPRPFPHRLLLFSWWQAQDL